jgi:hypothetical protein
MVMTSSSDQWIDRLFRHERLVFALCLIATIAFGLGGLKLSFSHDYRAFFDPKNPNLAAHEAMEQSFTQSDGVNLFLHKDKGDFYNQADLEAIEALTQAAWSIPHVIRVDSLVNYQHSQAEGDDLLVTPLFQDGEAAIPIEDIKRLGETDPLIKKRLISADGQTVQIIATTQLPEDRDALLPDIANAVEKLKTQFKQDYPGYKIATTGVIMLSNSFFEITIKDMTLLFPLMILLLGALMAYFFRSIALSVAALVVMGITIITTMGIAGWMGVKLTPASGQAPIIILTVAIADSIHLIVGARKYLNAGIKPLSAIRKSLFINAQPIFLTSVTTALGFLSLNFSDTPPFRDLGTIAAIGTIFAFLYSMLFLPLLLKRIKLTASSGQNVMERIELKLVEAVIRYKRLVLGLSLLLLAGAIALIPNLRINDNFVEWIAQGATFRDDADFISQELPGIYAVQFALKANDPAGISNVDYLHDLEKFSQWASNQEEVAHILSFDMIMRRLNKNIHGDDPAYETLPESQEAAAQYLLLYELSLPQGLDLNNMIDISRNSSRILVIMKNISSEKMLEFKARTRSWADNNLHNSQLSDASGTNIIFAHLTGSNIKSMFIGTLLAFLLIAGTIAIALRSLRYGILSLLPNLAPAIFTFGLWAIFHSEIGLYAAFVTATSLGLIVDFTVHLFSKYARAINMDHMTPENAMRDVFASTGMAIWVSAIVLLMGFLILTLSNFAIISLMAAMVALTIFIGLIADFTMTPALILTFARRD